MSRLKNLLKILVLCLPLVPFAQDSTVTIEALSSTYNFQTDTLSGTCFAIREKGQEYILTAAHLFRASVNDGDSVTVDMLVNNHLKTFTGKVFFHGNKNVDIAILRFAGPVGQGPGISLGKSLLRFAEPVYFYGFPLKNLGTDAESLKFPLVKKAIISGEINYLGVDVLVLDGHNNKGFSGGPAIAYDGINKKGSVIAVVSGYLTEQRKVANIHGEPVNLATDENSGIILCYGIKYIQDIMKKVK